MCQEDSCTKIHKAEGVRNIKSRWMKVEGETQDIVAVTQSGLSRLSPTEYGGYLSNAERKTGEGISGWGLHWVIWVFHSAKVKTADKILLKVALAGVAQWIECRPANRKVGSLISSQGTCLGCRPGLQLATD